MALCVYTPSTAYSQNLWLAAKVPWCFEQVTLQRELTPSSSEASDFLAEGTPTAPSGALTSLPHTRGHPGPATCKRAGEGTAALGPLSTPAGGIGSELPDHVTPQPPYREGSMICVLQMRERDPHRCPVPAGHQPAGLPVLP